MGSIISRFRSKRSTIEELEAIDKEISYIEKAKQSDVNTQKKIVGALILYSVVLYLLGVGLYYFLYWPEQWSQRLLYFTPLLVFPLLVIIIKKLLHWYFVKRISKNEIALEDMKSRKQSILEDVMDKETYKKAKEILQRFDPEKLSVIEGEAKTPVPSKAPEGQDVRQRSVTKSGPPATQSVPIKSPLAQSTPQPEASQQGAAQTPTSAQQPHNGRNTSMFHVTPRLPPPGPPMPRPILPRERSTMDKLVEYLVGEGPASRYALICHQCQSHNGMALKEEFEYISFRCCYCYTPNPARKQRPNAPRLPDDRRIPNFSARRHLSETLEKSKALELQQQMKSPDKTLNESHVTSTAADRSSTVTTGATSSDDVHDKKDK